jgi:DNA-binding response OmpR family regulator
VQATPLAESRGQAGGNPDLPLGFRGFAAGFQPEVAAFLQIHGPILSGLTRIEDMDMFASCISDMRPDYLLLGGNNQPPGLLDMVRAAARTAQLAVLVTGEGISVGEHTGQGLIVDTVAHDAGGADVALGLRALMRRSRPQALVGRTTWGDLELDEACLTFSIRGCPVSLSLEVFSVLGLMMDDPARIWERSTLHRLVFGAGSGNDLRAVDTRISRSRRHVSSALGCDPIRTVRGVGYALVPDP